MSSIIGHFETKGPAQIETKRNYLFKDWHQEIWSGANPSTIQIWTPLIHKDSKNGQMELIKESHKWGHVPHINRKPTLPVSPVGSKGFSSTGTSAVQATLGEAGLFQGGLNTGTSTGTSTGTAGDGPAADPASPGETGGGGYGG